MRRIVEYPEDATDHAIAEGYEYQRPLYYPSDSGTEVPVAMLTIAATVILQSIPDEKRHAVINQSVSR